jgi:hypothetical protein
MKRNEAYMVMRSNLKLDPEIYDAALRFQSAEISWGRFTEILAEKALMISEDFIGMRPPQFTGKDPGHFAGDEFEFTLDCWEEDYYGLEEK